MTMNNKSVQNAAEILFANIVLKVSMGYLYSRIFPLEILSWNTNILGSNVPKMVRGKYAFCIFFYVKIFAPRINVIDFCQLSL